MAKNNFIIILGIIVAILPFLGFPQKFKTLLFVLFGLLISLLAYHIGRAITTVGGKRDHF
ncbi:MAG: hypothetical protein AAB534_00040 [Patescibacteria group bacterium]